MKAGEGYCTDVTSGGASKLLLLAQGWAQRSNSICYAAAAYGGSKLGSFDHPRNTAQINLSLKLKLEVLPTGTYQNRHRNWHRNFGPETPVHRSFRYYGRNGAESTVISTLVTPHRYRDCRVESSQLTVPYCISTFRRSLRSPFCHHTKGGEQTSDKLNIDMHVF